MADEILDITNPIYLKVRIEGVVYSLHTPLNFTLRQYEDVVELVKKLDAEDNLSAKHQILSDICGLIIKDPDPSTLDFNTTLSFYDKAAMLNHFLGLATFGGTIGPRVSPDLPNSTDLGDGGTSQDTK